MKHLPLKPMGHLELLEQKPSLRQLAKQERNPFFAVLENIRSLHNVGAMFRTSDALLVKKIFLCGITSTPRQRRLSKTALGAQHTVPWEYGENAVTIVRRLKQEGVAIVGLEIAKNARPYYEFQYSFPCCLLVGSEVDGVSERVLAECDNVVNIPMLGKALSLNVSTAFGIVAYEMYRQFVS